MIHAQSFFGRPGCISLVIGRHVAVFGRHTGGVDGKPVDEADGLAVAFDVKRDIVRIDGIGKVRAIRFRVLLPRLA